jgi:hypothetical protein
VGRTPILSVVAAIVIALAVCSEAAASSVPRGTLSQAEYQQFLKTEQAEAHLGHGAITQVARRTCSGLTNISRVTRTQHAECEASFVFFYRLIEFTTAFAGCGKDSTKLAERRCLQRTIRTLAWSTNRFLTTDSASRKAALQRGFGGKCLDYLILTPPQKSAMNRLASGLHGLNRALTVGNAATLVAAARQFTTDMSVARRTLFVSATVKVCRHE